MTRPSTPPEHTRDTREVPDGRTGPISDSQGTPERPGTRIGPANTGRAGDHSDDGVEGAGHALATDFDGTTAGVPESIRRLVCVSVTHRSHDLDAVGALAPSDPLACATAVQRYDRVTEAVVLATCNRVEFYASTRTPQEEDRTAALDAIEEVIALPPEAQQYTGVDVLEHAARVAAGLESAVVGETEILGQVSDAFTTARETGIATGVLSRVGEVAIRAGKRARTETTLEQGPSSYESAVCRRIDDALDGDPNRVVVIGAGDIASSVTGAIRKHWPVRVDVVNRSPATWLTSPDGRWWPLSDLALAVAGADAVVTATGATEPVFEAKHAHRCTPGTPVVDLGNPADVAPDVATQTAVEVTDLDALAKRVDETAVERSAAIEDAESCILESCRRFIDDERANRAEDVLRQLHSDAREIRERELERATQRLAEGDADPETVLSEFASALAGRLLADPTDALRDAARERDDEVLRAARTLFDLDDPA